MMMNIRAFGLLLSSLAAVMFLSPEPTLRRASNNAEIVIVEAAAPVDSAKKATEDVFQTATGAAQKAGEEIRHLGEMAYEKFKQEDDHRQEHEGKMHSIKEKIQEAAQYQPNLGQGVGYYDQAFGIAGSDHGSDHGSRKVEDFLEGARESARDAMQQASEGLGILRRERSKIPPSVDSAKSSIREYYDSTKDALCQVIARREKELGTSLDHAKSTVKSYYDKAKDASVASVETQKDALEQYLDMVVDKLNAGREAVLNYAMHGVNRGKEARDAVVNAVHHGKDSVVHSVHHGKDFVVDSVHHGKDAMVDGVHRGKDAVVDGVHRGKEAVNQGKDVMVQETRRNVDNIQKKVQDMEGKMNETLKQAGKWAHDKMVKLNETEEMALAMCKQWIQKSVISVVRLLHLFVFSSVYGSALWVTFISGFALARSITRHQFGVVQSKIFPVYFRVLASGIAILLATHMILHPFPSADLSEFLQYQNLAACLALTLLNTFVLEPQATKYMFEKLRLEKDEVRIGEGGQAPTVVDEVARDHMNSTSRKLSKVHSLSSAANMAVLIGLTWHLWYLNCRLVI